MCKINEFAGNSSIVKGFKTIIPRQTHYCKIYAPLGHKMYSLSPNVQNSIVSMMYRRSVGDKPFLKPLLTKIYDYRHIC